MSMAKAAVPERERAAAGILWMLATMFFFITLDTFAKVLLQDFPVIEVTWARFAFHAATVALLLAPRMMVLVRANAIGLQLLRSALLAATTVLFFLGLRSVPLATASSIMFLSPILVTVLAVPILGERVGIRRWLGVAAGFSGALIIVRPGGGFLAAGAGFVLAAAFTNALYQVITRKIRALDEPLTTLFYTALIGAAALTPAVPFHWVTPGAFDLLLMAGTGIAGGIGHFCLIRAFAAAPAAVVAPFTYTGLLWATLLGYLVFAELPDLWTMVGAAVIAMSGLFILHRERRVGFGDPAG